MLVPPLESLLSKPMESTEEHGSRSLCETEVEGVSSGSEVELRVLQPVAVTRRRVRPQARAPGIRAYAGRTNLYFCVF